MCVRNGGGRFTSGGAASPAGGEGGKGGLHVVAHTTIVAAIDHALKKTGT